MWALYDFLSRALLPHHRRCAVLCAETTPSRESRQFDEHPRDGASPVAAEIHRLLTPPSRQLQRTESRAAFDNAEPEERSQLPAEVARQRDLAVCPRRQIRRQRMEPFRWFSIRGSRNRSLPYCSFALTNPRSCCATYPNRRRKPESHAAQRRGCRPT